LQLFRPLPDKTSLRRKLLKTPHPNYPGKGRGALLVTASGRIAVATRVARRCLRQYLGVEDGSLLLPAALARWVQSSPQEPYCAGRHGYRVVITPIDRGRKGTTFFLIEELVIENERLTYQEAVVLGWVRKGKSDVEIAQILTVKISTVKKHLQRTYIKLGVENRTAAAYYASHLLF
jgi:DNA-binding NarL/FixJ family response regulator